MVVRPRITDCVRVERAQLDAFTEYLAVLEHFSLGRPRHSGAAHDLYNRLTTSLAGDGARVERIDLLVLEKAAADLVDLGERRDGPSETSAMALAMAVLQLRTVIADQMIVPRSTMERT